MHTLSPNEWQAVSPYLDQALAMSEDQRAAWLRTLAEHNPTLVARLTELLNEHNVLSQEGFLRREPSDCRAPCRLPARSLGHTP